MPFEQVEPRPRIVEGEHEVLRFWERADIFERLRKKNEGEARWSFLDGPITANNPMGVHHAWGRTYKDVFQRYFAMRGFDQRWQNGFDCQGLWVEVEVEKELGFKSKRDIEDYGLEAFIEKCKERVIKYSDTMTQQSIRLGMWMDWPNSYFTMSEENNYHIWQFLKKCHEGGHVYKGLDSMPWCPRCGTGISEQERKEGYMSVEDEAIYVRFPLRGRDRESLLIWTTTPWTLPANVAAAVSGDITYVKVRQGEDVFYLAKNCLAVLDSKKADLGEPEVIAELSGSAMLGWEFDGPFDHLKGAHSAVAAHRVIAWDGVSDTEGTGIVHIAPGCGKEDFDLSKTENLPVISPIDENGIYLEGFGELTGRPAADVSEEVSSDLRSRGLFYKRERYVHDYPHCWRCDTPLLFRAVDEWYIDMSWRDRIKEVARQINWIPDYTLDLELDWLKNMGDWMISKKRYWGLALPIWECRECGTFDVIGSREELRERAIEGWEQFEGHTPHRPWIDAVKIACRKCGARASRIPDVGNPWLDAGIVPYSTVEYGTNREYWAKWIPADFIVESFPGQFRNWFYSLLAMSTMLEDIPPFRSCLGYMTVRDEHGQEMHKSKGNALEFNEAADRAGSDVMRWLYCRQNPMHNLNFGYHVLDQISRKVFGTLWNTYLFCCNYARLDEFDPRAPKIPVSERLEIDRWILSNLQILAKSAEEQFPQYWVSPFIRRAEEFIDELSNWYVRRNRQRFWDPRGKDEGSKMAAYQTLYEVLVTLTKLLAPVIPFITERMWENLVVKGMGNSESDSVHLTDYPTADESLIDETLSFEMRVAQQITATGHSLREAASHRVRQPLKELRVASTDNRYRAALDNLGHYAQEELNVKKLTVTHDLGDLTSVTAKPNFAALGPRFGRDVQKVAEAILQMPHEAVRKLQGAEAASVEIDGAEIEISPDDVHVHIETASGWFVAEAGPLMIALDSTLDDELLSEGLARDAVRHIQNLRKEVGLDIQDRITVDYATGDTQLRDAIAKWRDYITGEVQSDSLVPHDSLQKGTEVELFGGRKLSLEIEKV